MKRKYLTLVFYCFIIHIAIAQETDSPKNDSEPIANAALNAANAIVKKSVSDTLKSIMAALKKMQSDIDSIKGDEGIKDVVHASVYSLYPGKVQIYSIDKDAQKQKLEARKDSVTNALQVVKDNKKELQKDIDEGEDVLRNFGNDAIKLKEIIVKLADSIPRKKELQSELDDLNKKITAEQKHQKVLQRNFEDISERENEIIKKKKELDEWKYDEEQIDSVRILQQSDTASIEVFMQKAEEMLVFQGDGINLKGYSKSGLTKLWLIQPSSMRGSYIYIQDFLSYNELRKGFSGDTLFTIMSDKKHNAIMQINDTTKDYQLDETSFDVMVGTNFDFVDGVNPKNIAASAELFLPDKFRLCKNGEKRWGLDFGLYENRLVTVDSSSDTAVSYRLDTLNATGTYDIYAGDARVSTTNKVKNLGAWGSLLYRLGDGTNPVFRGYLEFCFEFIQRDVTQITSYDLSKVILAGDTPAVAYNTKPPEAVNSLSFGEEYFSGGIMQRYCDGEFDFSGELLIGLFSSPNQIYHYHPKHQFILNWFYNANFELSYRNWIAISGEIRHNYPFSQKPTYFTVSVSKIIPMSAVVSAAKKLFGFND